MTKKISRLVLPILLLAAFAVQAQPVTDIEIGFRWNDISGNPLMYRSQINEKEGFVLRSFTVISNEKSGPFDQFRIDASEIGNSPAGALRLDATRTGAYRLRLNYRQTESFSALPSFANPLLGQGIFVSQHTLDRNRTLIDADLEFIPGRKFSPFIGYTYNRNNGPGTTTYAVGQDEFLLRSDLNDKDQELRGGLNFTLGSFTGQVTQGWRDFSGTENLLLAQGAGGGNNNFPILGRPVSASDLTLKTRTDVSSPFTNAWVAGQVGSRVRLIGNFVRLSADTDDASNDSVTGSLISFAEGRFFSGLTETIDSRAENKTWRGEGRAEISIVDGVDFIAGYRRDHREVNGSALVNSLLIDSVTFAGSDRRDFQSILDARNGFERDEDTLSATVSARLLGPFSIRAGFSQTDQDILLSPDLSEVVVVEGNSGAFNRKISTFDTTASFAKRNVSVGASWRRDRADDAVFRTDFTDRDRYRLRAAFTGPRNLFRLGATAEQIEQTNDLLGVGYDGQVRQYAADVEVIPVPKIRFRAGASQFKADSTVSFLQPQNFAVGQSLYAEKGKGIEGGVGFFLPKFSIDADVARFDNEGIIPFKIDRYRARLVYDFLAKTGIGAEWSRDEYTEETSTLGDYDATRYGLFLRYRP